MPPTFGHYGQLTGSKRSHLSLTAVKDGQLRFARKNEEKLVAFAVKLPWGTPTEGSNATRATVEGEVPDRTVWFGVQFREIHLNHAGD